MANGDERSGGCALRAPPPGLQGLGAETHPWEEILTYKDSVALQLEGGSETRLLSFRWELFRLVQLCEHSQGSGAILESSLF